MDVDRDQRLDFHSVSVLPRRAFLDVELPPDQEAFSSSGMRVAAVREGGMADRAGVRADDVVQRLAGLPIRNLAELGAAARMAGATPTSTIEYARAGEVHAATVAVTCYPPEEIAGIAIEYGELAVGDVRLRTIVTSAARPRAMVLVIQGIACESIDGGEGPLVALVHGWARAGIDTVRVDKHGVGDSEGPACREIDFETEVGGFAAALGLARVRASALGVPLVVFGHSVGGIIAAELAFDRVAGIITYGAPASQWLACLVDTTRRQMALRGISEAEIDREATALAARAFTEGLNGRCGAYHRQLDAIDPAASWSRVEVPVLVVRGEHDWVVRADDQARIASLANRRSSIVDLPGIDHVLGWHPDQASSLRDYGAGRFDPAIVATTVEWIGQL